MRLPVIITSFLLSLTLLGLICLAYSPSLHGTFISDDLTVIVQNPLLRAKNGWAIFWTSTAADDYWPLWYSFLWVEYQIWGSDPLPFHVVSLILHWGVSLLLWHVLMRLQWRMSRLHAWLIAALFAVHPVNAEAVAWIIQQKTLLSAAFCLTAVICYQRYQTRQTFWNLSAASISFALGLLCKSSIITLPVALTVIYWPRAKSKTVRAHVKSLIPLYALSIVLGCVSLWYKAHHFANSAPVRDDGLFSRTEIAARAIWFYLEKAWWPHHLGFIYPRWDLNQSFGTGLAPLGAFLCMLLIVYKLPQVTRRSVFHILCWACAMLLPCLGFIDISFMRDSLVADHWQYLAVPAWLLLGALVIREAVHSLLFLRPIFKATVYQCAALLLVLGGILLTRTYVITFAGEEALWRATLEINPEAFIAHNNLALALETQGKLDEAYEHLVIAATLHPESPEIWLINEAQIRQTQGRMAEALQLYQRAATLAPHSGPAQYSLARALQSFGDSTSAVSHYRLAIQEEPDLAASWSNLGILLYTQGNSVDAKDCLRKAIALQPELSTAHNALGAILLMEGSLNQAEIELVTASKLAPGTAEIFQNLQLLRDRRLFLLQK